MTLQFLLNVDIDKEKYLEWCLRHRKKMAWYVHDGNETPFVRFLIEDNKGFRASIYKGIITVYNPLDRSNYTTRKAPDWVLETEALCDEQDRVSFKQIISILEETS